jgi:transcription elongation GreA/GreB family factor
MENKESLRKLIIDALTKDFETANNAANTAKETATSKETVAENKYDTFGLEASYLAHGQSIRVNELAEAIERYTNLPFKQFGGHDNVDTTALVTLETENDNNKYFFIGPEAGGLKLHWEGKDIMVITPSTPLGRQLLGKQLDDTIELHIKNNRIIYEIIAVD